MSTTNIAEIAAENNGYGRPVTIRAYVPNLPQMPEGRASDAEINRFVDNRKAVQYVRDCIPFAIDFGVNATLWRASEDHTYERTNRQTGEVTTQRDRRMHMYLGRRRGQAGERRPYLMVHNDDKELANAIIDFQTDGKGNSCPGYIESVSADGRTVQFAIYVSQNMRDNNLARQEQEAQTSNQLSVAEVA